MFVGMVVSTPKNDFMVGTKLDRIPPHFDSLLLGVLSKLGHQGRDPLANARDDSLWG